MDGYYRIAEKNIRISSIYDKVHSYCREYATDAFAAPDISVSIAASDIDYERKKTTLPSTDADLEILAVYRKIAEEMPYHGTFLFHASCICVNGEGVLFTAPSGTGKSTHARLWREYLGDRAFMVNDDKPLIHVGRETVKVYGTPYNGKHRLGRNVSVPLKAIAIIERAEENRTVKLEPKEYSKYYPRLLQQMYRCVDVVAFSEALELLDTMLKRVPVYVICCNMEPEAAEVAYETIFREKF